MARLLRTVDDLVTEVRSILDESNTDNISTPDDILNALNRAQEFGFDILARKYPEPLLQYATLDIVDGTSEYTLPENIFEDRIVKLEANIPSGSLSNYIEIPRISFKDLSEYENTQKTDIPYAYCAFSRTIRLVPCPNGRYDGRMWYLREPERLLINRGRITAVSVASNYLTVSAIDSTLSTNTDNLASYINVIDGQTGEIKCSLQVQTLDTTNVRITTRTSPTDSTVLGRTIASAIPSTVAKNDYVCLVQGTCVPYGSAPLTNFLVAYAVAEITRKVGGDINAEEAVLQKFEKQLERTQFGRRSSFRIKRTNNIWNSGTPRNLLTPRSSS